MNTDLESLAITILSALDDRTLATCESLTGGLIGATITSIPGASRNYLGGLIAYSTEVKKSLAHVSDQSLTHSVISEEVAIDMARAAAHACGADFGIGITGVAGPDRQEGHPVGTVCVAVFSANSAGVQILESETLHLEAPAGTADQQRTWIRHESVAGALELLLTVL